MGNARGAIYGLLLCLGLAGIKKKVIAALDSSAGYGSIYVYRASFIAINAVIITIPVVFAKFSPCS